MRWQEDKINAISTWAFSHDHYVKSLDTISYCKSNNCYLIINYHMYLNIYSILPIWRSTILLNNEDLLNHTQDSKTQEGPSAVVLCCVSLERAEMLCAIGHAFFLKHLKKIIFIVKHHLLWSWAPPWLISCTGMTYYSFTLWVTFKAMGHSSFIMLHTAAELVLSSQLALRLMLSVWQVVHSVATTLQLCLGFLLPLKANTQSSC